MPTQMNHQKGPNNYKRASSNTDGGPYATQAQTNFDGGRTTKKGGGKAKRQMNFDITVSTPTGYEKGQGQKSGTGCNGGY